MNVESLSQAIIPTLPKKPYSRNQANCVGGCCAGMTAIFLTPQRVKERKIICVTIALWLRPSSGGPTLRHRGIIRANCKCYAEKKKSRVSCSSSGVVIGLRPTKRMRWRRYCLFLDFQLRKRKKMAAAAKGTPR